MMAFYFDRAVTSFGLAFEADVEEYVAEFAQTKGKKSPSRKAIEQRRQSRVALWLDDGEGPKPKRFADPAIGIRR